MDRSVYIALSGAVMQQRRLDVLTHNLANINTVGYKKKRMVFEVVQGGGPVERSFVRIKGVMNDMTQGVLEERQNPLDVAIKGDGFFVVETPMGYRYSRYGHLTLSTDGVLTTSDGYPVMGKKGIIRLSDPDVRIDEQGNIIDRNGVKVDRLKVVTFDNPEMLVYEGGAFRAYGAGVVEKEVEDARIVQGYVELSNVNPVREMVSMIDAMRAYESHARVIQSVDEVTRKAVEEIGRV